MFNFIFEEAEASDIPALIKMSEDAHALMKDKLMYVPMTVKELEDAFSGNGLLLRVKAMGELAGGLYVNFNPPEDIYKSSVDISKAIDMDNCVVAPQWRGNHFEEQLLEIAEAKIRHMDSKWLVATVHPDNASSFISLTRRGFKVLKIVPYAYDIGPRYIMGKEIGRHV